VPTEQGLGRHDKRVSPPPRQHPSKRSQKGTIGRPQRRPSRLPAEHDELMTQNHQFDVFGELVASPSDQQLQDCGESEISEERIMRRSSQGPRPVGPRRNHQDGGREARLDLILARA